MAQALKTLVAICVADAVFSLLCSSKSMKKQLHTVCAVAFLAQTVKLIFALFGR